MNRCINGLLAGGLAVLLAAVCPPTARAAEAAGDGRAHFNRDVRPILSDTCFKCHGPDKNKIAGKLSLDVRAEAVKDRGGYAAIVPGNSQKSEAYRRLVSDDPQKHMPPLDSGLILTPTQVDTLKKWIDQGAEYQAHWSFIPPAAPPVPPVKNPEWCINPIDRFILARLEKEGLTPQPQADEATLARRLSLDLTGLPPTPKEVDDCLADPTPGSYGRVVDRLLASPHYGERMAQEWLDAARYADTSGYQADWERSMWPWRDWVIRSFNANMPFDRFTVEQLAGDMLPNATIEQKLATGFNRNHRINDEGGIIPAEYAVEYVVDRVETTSAVWLGLTTGCARCHDHKYDPVSQKEFYRLFALFNNVPEKGQDGRTGFAAPFIRIPTPEQSAEAERLAREQESIQRALDADTPESVARRDAWIASTSAALAADDAAPRWSGQFVSADGTGAALQRQPDDSVVAVDVASDLVTFNLTIRSETDRVTALRVQVLPSDTFPGERLGRGDGNFVLTEVEATVTPADGKGGAKPVMIARAVADYQQEKWEVANAIDGKAGTGWAVDGYVLRGPRAAVFTLAEPIESARGATFTIRLKQGTKTLKQHSLNRARVTLTGAEKPGVSPIDTLSDDVAAALRAPAAKRTPAQADAIAEHFRREDPSAAPRWARLVALARQANKMAQGTPVMVMQEMPKSRDTYLLKRGLYDQPDKSEKLTGGIPAAIAANGAAQPRNRLEFARWVVSRENPLTARVTVNRIWQHCFGVGLVKTSEDFGAQGEWPSHPELLDWLATEFVRSGWDLKALQKLIVTSATYRQSSRVTPQLIERDPENRLLARGPRFRLDAMAIRDNALAVSGLLSADIGGPPVKPYQPAGLWEELSFTDKTTVDKYVQSHGEDLYRRSMYTFWKRTVPPPSLALFDAAGREACAVRLGRTNTPLQALNLLNDVIYVESARKLAERMLKEGGSTPADRLTYGWRLAMARKPEGPELASLSKGFAAYLAKYRFNPGAATALLDVGESPRDDSLDPAELAAYTAAANVILNLDEAITKE
jgi:hypothetical protein